MQANSRPVTSSQTHTHNRLPSLLRRHLACEYRKPVASHSRAAFKTLSSTLADNQRPLMLDSFCGSGHSTIALANKNPNYLVVGVDKSAHRLGKQPARKTDNCLLLQAECEDIWQLLRAEGLTVVHHYLLYPNPWPKPKHLQRRIHGSGAFRWLLDLGGRVELRSNWKIYVEEFGLAMQLAGHPGIVFQTQPSAPLTLFESKYLSSGHAIWSFIGQASHSANSDEMAIIG
ncbi:MAG: SAM-dependent methyltransferase [Halieaceae bacterium]|nr:SAM-dependent methyltransferase [Halieaceae bacterium]